MGKGKTVNYTIEAEEPYEDYSLYKPYSGSITSTQNEAINVWLERTTAEEQEAQRVAAENKRQEVAKLQCDREIDTYPLVLVARKGYTEYGYIIVEGLVKNRSSATLENVEAVATIFTDDGAFIKSDSALIDYDVLLPGQTSPFKVYAGENPAFGKYQVEFREFWGSRIGTVLAEDDCSQ